MANKVEQLITELTLDDKKFITGIKSNKGIMHDFSNATKKVTVGIGALGAAATATTGALAVITKQTIDQGDKFDKLSQRIGISVEKLSAYEHVANLAGTSLEGMTVGVRRLSKNILDMDRGIGEAKRSFEALNINVRKSNGQLKDSDEIMLEVADKFSKMEDGAEKTGIAMELFGRSGADLIPMFNQGAEGMAAMLEEGTKLRGWTTEQAAQAAELQDNMSRLTTGIKGLKDNIGQQLIPATNAVVEATNNWFNANQELMLNSISKLPKLINEYIIPALLGMIGTTIDVKTKTSGMWNKMNEWTIKAIGWLDKFANKNRDDIKYVAADTDRIVNEMLAEIKKKDKKIKDSAVKAKKELIELQNFLLNTTKNIHRKTEEVTIKTNDVIVQDTEDTKTELLKIMEEDERNTKDSYDYKVEVAHLTNYRLVELDKSYWDSVKDGWNNYVNDELPSYVDSTVGMFKSMTSSTTSLWSSMIYDTMTGSTKSFSDYWESFCQSMARAFADAVAQMIAKWALLQVGLGSPTPTASILPTATSQIISGGATKVEGSIVGGGAAVVGGKIVGGIGGPTAMAEPILSGAPATAGGTSLITTIASGAIYGGIAALAGGALYNMITGKDIFSEPGKTWQEMGWSKEEVNKARQIGGYNLVGGLYKTGGRTWKDLVPASAWKKHELMQMGWSAEEIDKAKSIATNRNLQIRTVPKTAERTGWQYLIPDAFYGKDRERFSADQGGVITQFGVMPFRNDERLINTRLGETIRTPKQEAQLKSNVTLNFNLYGIDRNNARDVTRKAIIPELDVYLTSQGHERLGGGR